MKNLITGGAGFIGSHIIEKVLLSGEEVICLDNLSTGDLRNLKKWQNNSKLKFIKTDIENFIDLEVDKIWHLACPGSPAFYQEDPIKTTKTIFSGTVNVLELSKRYKAKLLIASSSEIYGNPKEHPQKEEYFGNVNPIGKRSCYEEGKRIAESLCIDYSNKYNLDIKIARIFNCYGKNMKLNDGRVIYNFILQSLKNEPITIYGDGLQTRSFCFIDDLIDGLFRFMNTTFHQPINLGNKEEITILELAELIKAKCSSESKIIHLPTREDEPLKRRPDIALSKKVLNWHPKVNIEDGLEKTINYLKEIHVANN